MHRKDDGIFDLNGWIEDMWRQSGVKPEKAMDKDAVKGEKKTYKPRKNSTSEKNTMKYEKKQEEILDMGGTGDVMIEKLMQKLTVGKMEQETFNRTEWVRRVNTTWIIQTQLSTGTSSYCTLEGTSHTWGCGDIARMGRQQHGYGWSCGIEGIRQWRRWVDDGWQYNDMTWQNSAMHSIASSRCHRWGNCSLHNRTIPRVPLLDSHRRTSIRGATHSKGRDNTEDNLVDQCRGDNTMDCTMDNTVDMEEEDSTVIGRTTIISMYV